MVDINKAYSYRQPAGDGGSHLAQVTATTDIVTRSQDEAGVADAPSFMPYGLETAQQSAAGASDLLRLNIGNNSNLPAKVLGTDNLNGKDGWGQPTFVPEKGWMFITRRIPTSGDSKAWANRSIAAENFNDNPFGSGFAIYMYRLIDDGSGNTRWELVGNAQRVAITLDHYVAHSPVAIPDPFDSTKYIVAVAYAEYEGNSATHMGGINSTTGEYKPTVGAQHGQGRRLDGFNPHSDEGHSLKLAKFEVTFTGNTDVTFTRSGEIELSNVDETKTFSIFPGTAITNGKDHNGHRIYNKNVSGVFHRHPVDVVTQAPPFSEIYCPESDMSLGNETFRKNFKGIAYIAWRPYSGGNCNNGTKSSTLTQVAAIDLTGKRFRNATIAAGVALPEVREIKWTANNGNEHQTLTSITVADSGATTTDALLSMRILQRRWMKSYTCASSILSTGGGEPSYFRVGVRNLFISLPNVNEIHTGASTDDKDFATLPKLHVHWLEGEADRNTVAHFETFDRTSATHDLNTAKVLTVQALSNGSRTDGESDRVPLLNTATNAQYSGLNAPASAIKTTPTNGTVFYNQNGYSIYDPFQVKGSGIADSTSKYSYLPRCNHFTLEGDAALTTPFYWKESINTSETKHRQNFTMWVQGVPGTHPKNDFTNGNNFPWTSFSATTHHGGPFNYGAAAHESDRNGFTLMPFNLRQAKAFSLEKTTGLWDTFLSKGLKRNNSSIISPIIENWADLSFTFVHEHASRLATNTSVNTNELLSFSPQVDIADTTLTDGRRYSGMFAPMNTYNVMWQEHSVIGDAHRTHASSFHLTDGTSPGISQWNSTSTDSPGVIVVQHQDPTGMWGTYGSWDSDAEVNAHANARSNETYPNDLFIDKTVESAFFQNETLRLLKRFAATDDNNESQNTSNDTWEVRGRSLRNHPTETVMASYLGHALRFDQDPDEVTKLLFTRTGTLETTTKSRLFRHYSIFDYSMGVGVHSMESENMLQGQMLSHLTYGLQLAGYSTNAIAAGHAAEGAPHLVYPRMDSLGTFGITPNARLLNEKLPGTDRQLTRGEDKESAIIQVDEGGIDTDWAANGYERGILNKGTWSRTNNKLATREALASSMFLPSVVHSTIKRKHAFHSERSDYYTNRMFKDGNNTDTAALAVEWLSFRGFQVLSNVTGIYGISDPASADVNQNLLLAFLVRDYKVFPHARAKTTVPDGRDTEYRQVAGTYTANTSPKTAHNFDTKVVFIRYKSTDPSSSGKIGTASRGDSSTWELVDWFSLPFLGQVGGILPSGFQAGRDDLWSNYITVSRANLVAGSLVEGNSTSVGAGPYEKSTFGSIFRAANFLITGELPGVHSTVNKIYGDIRNVNEQILLDPLSATTPAMNPFYVYRPTDKKIPEDNIAGLKSGTTTIDATESNLLAVAPGDINAHRHNWTKMLEIQAFIPPAQNSKAQGSTGVKKIFTFLGVPLCSRISGLLVGYRHMITNRPTPYLPGGAVLNGTYHCGDELLERGTRHSGWFMFILENVSDGQITGINTKTNVSVGESFGASATHTGSISTFKWSTANVGGGSLNIEPGSCSAGFSGSCSAITVSASDDTFQASHVSRLLTVEGGGNTGQASQYINVFHKQADLSVTAASTTASSVTEGVSTLPVTYTIDNHSTSGTSIDFKLGAYLVPSAASASFATDWETTNPWDNSINNYRLTGKANTYIASMGTVATTSGTAEFAVPIREYSGAHRLFVVADWYKRNQNNGYEANTDVTSGQLSNNIFDTSDQVSIVSGTKSVTAGTDLIVDAVSGPAAVYGAKDVVDEISALVRNQGDTAITTPFYVQFGSVVPGHTYDASLTASLGSVLINPAKFEGGNLSAGHTFIVANRNDGSEGDLNNAQMMFVQPSTLGGASAEGYVFAIVDSTNTIAEVNDVAFVDTDGSSSGTNVLSVKNLGDGTSIFGKIPCTPGGGTAPTFTGTVSGGPTKFITGLVKRTPSISVSADNNNNGAVSYSIVQTSPSSPFSNPHINDVSGSGGARISQVNSTTTFSYTIYAKNNACFSTTTHSVTGFAPPSLTNYQSPVVTPATATTCYALPNSNEFWTLTVSSSASIPVATSTGLGSPDAGIIQVWHQVQPVPHHTLGGGLFTVEKLASTVVNSVTSSNTVSEFKILPTDQLPRDRDLSFGFAVTPQVYAGIGSVGLPMLSASAASVTATLNINKTTAGEVLGPNSGCGQELPVIEPLVPEDVLCIDTFNRAFATDMVEQDETLVNIGNIQLHSSPTVEQLRAISGGNYTPSLNNPLVTRDKYIQQTFSLSAAPTGSSASPSTFQIGDRKGYLAVNFIFDNLSHGNMQILQGSANPPTEIATTIERAPTVFASETGLMTIGLSPNWYYQVNDNMAGGTSSLSANAYTITGVANL